MIWALFYFLHELIDIIMPKKQKQEEKSTKATFNVPDGKGLLDWFNFVCASWYDFQESDDLRYSDVREVYPSHVIVARGWGETTKMYQVPYTVTDGEIAFDLDAMVKVELKIEFVQKVFNKAARQVNPLAIKTVGENRIGAYGIIWGDEQTKDSDDQFFTKSTSGLLDIFEAMGRLPWLVHHGADGVIKSTVMGEIDTMVLDDTGLWYEARILEQELYKQYVEQMIVNKKLYSSSGALPAAVKASKNGEITTWPIFEVTGTWLPAEFRFMSSGYSIDRIKSHFKAIGIDVSEFVFDKDADDPEKAQKSDGGTDAEKAAVDEDGADTEEEALEAGKSWLRLQRLAI